MTVLTLNVDDEYKKNGQLKKENINSLKEWLQKQPHLPKISELQLILFLHSCYYSIEKTKNTIDTFFTIRTHCPEFFANRNPTANEIKEMQNVVLYSPLPKATLDGNRVILVRLMDSDPSKYVFSDQLKSFDMVSMLWLTQEGTSNGHIIVNDMQGITFGHMARLGIMNMKKFLFYLQEAMPLRLKGLHFINVVPFMDKILAMMKPFMKKELMDMLFLHTDSIESLYKYVPQECLPKEYGGCAGSIYDLHEQSKKNCIDNVQFFLEEQKQVVDESLRPGKPKNIGDIFGVEGTFKKLDLD